MKYLSYIPFLFFALPASAQLDNTVEVTNEVKPVVKDANKINILPSAAETKAKHYQVQYSTQTQPVKEFPYEFMRDYSSDAVLKGNKRGYLQLAGGSHGNIDSHAAYQFDFTDNDALSIDLTLKGFNGKTRQRKEEPYNWTSRFYKSRAGARFDHRFDNGADLYVKGGFENQVFNYIQSISSSLINATDKQHNVLADFCAGITPYQTGNFSIGAEGNLKFFSQDHFTAFDKKAGETVMQLTVDADYKITDEHSVALGAEVFSSSYGMDEVKGITHMHFTPHYIYNADMFRLQAGVVVGTDGDIAPDVRFAYHVTPQSDVYVKAAGYDEDNDLRRLSSINPYAQLSPQLYGGIDNKKYKLDAEFHKIDASIGYRFNFSELGLSGDINGGYDLSTNHAEINWISNSHNGLDYPWFSFNDYQRFYINADIAYAYKDIVKVDAKNQFNASKHKEEGTWKTGSYDTPNIDLRWKADVKIIKDLYFGIDWELACFDDPEHLIDGGSAYKRPTINNWGASLRYTLPLEFPATVFVKGDNLLNQKFDRYTGYRNIGANVLAGFALSF